jgi:hypothetical protein
MQKSDNQTRNQRSWRTFREQHDPEARRERRGAKKSLPPQEVVPQSPTISSPQPATTLSEAPSPATSEESNSESPGCGQGPKPTHLRQSKKARTEVPPGAAAPEAEVIDLTGEPLVHAKQFKRALRKKGWVRLLIVGEDNVPFSCVIPPSDSEGEEEPGVLDEQCGPWSHLDSADFEI